MAPPGSKIKTLSPEETPTSAPLPPPCTLTQHRLQLLPKQSDFCFEIICQHLWQTKTSRGLMFQMPRTVLKP